MMRRMMTPWQRPTRPSVPLQRVSLVEAHGGGARVQEAQLPHDHYDG